MRQAQEAEQEKERREQLGDQLLRDVALGSKRVHEPEKMKPSNKRVRIQQQQDEEKKKRIDLDKLLRPVRDQNINKSPLIVEPFHGQHIIPQPPFRMLVAGPGTAGKTEFIISLMLRKEFYLDYFTRFIVLSPNCHGAQWDRMHNKLRERMECFDFFDADTERALWDLYESNRKLVEKLGRDLAPRIVLIFDDMVDDTLLNKSRILRMLATRGRHANMSTLYSSQYYNGFPLRLRKQLTNVIMFESGNKKEIEALYKEFGHRKLSFKQFERLFELCTAERHSFLHVNMQAEPEERYRKKFSYVFIINGNPIKTPNDVSMIRIQE